MGPFRSRVTSVYTRLSLRKDFSFLKTEEDRVDRFKRLMEQIIKEDSKNLFKEFQAVRGGKSTIQAWDQIEKGSYFSGSDAVKAGVADSLGTIQKTILKEFPNAQLYYIPNIRGSWLDRRYSGRSLKTGSITSLGIYIFFFLIVSYKVASYIFKLLVAASAAPKRTGKNGEEIPN